MDFFPTGTVITGEEMTRKMLAEEVTSHLWLGLYKRFCWDGIVFPEGRTYEDLTVAYQAFRKVGHVGFLMEPLYYYRVNDESITKTVNSRKIYDIFMAFQDRYHDILEEYPDLAEKNCARAAHYGASLYFHYCAGKVESLRFAVPEVRRFLDAHKKVIQRSWAIIPRSRRLALRLYYLSPGLFRVGARVMYLTGIQKKLGFQMK